MRADLNPTPSASAGDKPYRIGTLRYSRGQLVRLFGLFAIGGFAYAMIYQIDPRVLPVLLEKQGANYKQIAIIIGSITALINTFAEAIGAYRSDRTRSRWGRRIPYIFLATPIVTLFILSLPFAPQVGAWAGRVPILAWIMDKLPWSPVILTFALLITCYKVFFNLVAAIYLCLIADVVPVSHLGRFHAIFRLIGCFCTFVGNYWLIKITDKYGGVILYGMAAVNLVGFLIISLCVKEGDYPPVEARKEESGAMLTGMKDFMNAGFREPIYLWTYLTRVLVFAANATSFFIPFVARAELNISLGHAGELLGLASLGWFALAYPVGRLLDRFGSVRSMTVALALGTVAFFLSFFVIRGEKSFLAISFVNAIIFWTVWSSEVMLAQQIFDRRRMGQLGAANSIVKSVVIALGTSPFTGIYMDLVASYTSHLRVPLVPELPIGGLRFIYLYLALIYAVALLSILQVRRHWVRRGGPDHYRPPGVDELTASVPA